MREGFALFVAVIAAALCASVLTVVSAWAAIPGQHPSDMLWALPIVFAGCFAYAMVVGLPIAIALNHKRRFRPGTMAIGGAMAGLLPAAVLLWPSSIPSTVPLEDWGYFGLIVACGGAIGAASGVSFFAAHRLMSPNNSFKPKPLRGSA